MSNQSERSSGARLSRAAIIDAALSLVDLKGPAGLSMRALGAELGVEAMSLYRHVHGKEDLLEGVVDELTAELVVVMEREAEGHWQTFLQNVAHAVRDIAVAHPRAFPLIATRHPAAPWLRPPLRSIEAVDIFLRVLLQHGFTDEQAVGAYRGFSSFLIGQLLLEAAVRGADVGGTLAGQGETGPVSTGEAQVASLDDAPEVLRLRPLLSEDHSKEEFDTALEILLDRLEVDLSL
ncbi:TetR/AcrR family transcriptional regulator C-terminal domain-containing protein [Microbacterium sp. KSW-18]|uniref:TetR/AcrR family transcriptional regulator C-terminal domain-containing protein n=1 Tax=Microbacterium aquilitoris TaxID=3067307 RepID=A0ABU3GGL0_9MICO|nr:TetR/AcrR family transcriptional regulator C-terminal domain-containing protein [Microbacterium sp. KSW-18]MDT3329842.1 TetR/AcrR family transcriptional regulator C-terminal domain-containing protein [Microbacterium sp. KSW-18]